MPFLKKEIENYVQSIIKLTSDIVCARDFFNSLGQLVGSIDVNTFLLHKSIN